MTTITTRIALVAAIWCALCVVPGGASAQCSFDSSVPTEGAVVAEAPAPIVINFMLGIELQAVRLVDASGTAWPIDWVKTDENVFKAEFRVTEPLPPGTYQIVWSAYVRQHYHPDGGVIAFTVAPRGANGDAEVKPAAAPPAAAVHRGATGWPYRALQAGAAPKADR